MRRVRFDLALVCRRQAQTVKANCFHQVAEASIRSGSVPVQVIKYMFVSELVWEIVSDFVWEIVCELVCVARGASEVVSEFVCVRLCS